MDDKIFRFRGKTMEELKEMKFTDFSKLLPSQLKRKVKRGFTEQEELLIVKMRDSKKKVRTHVRDMFVIPAFVDKKIEIYNGKSFISLKILPEMLNLRLGELAPTRRIGVKHSGKADATSNPKAEGGKKE